MSDALPIVQAVIQCALALLFIGAGAPKVLGLGTVGGNWRKFGLPHLVWRAIGCAELGGAAGLLAGVFVDARCGVASAGALAVLMVGALRSHSKVHDKPGEYIAPVVALIGSLGVVAARGLALLS